MSLVPPQKAVVAAVALVTPVVLAAILTAYVAGAVAVVGLVLGVIAGVQAALLQVPTVARAAVVLLAAAGAGFGAVADSPLTVALVVAAIALAQTPLTRVAGSLGALLVVVPAVTATVPLPDQPWTLAGWAAAGAVLVIAVARVVGVTGPADPVSDREAWSHGLALTVLAGAAAYVVSERELIHGYWLILTVAQVLRPDVDETPLLARHRITGTIVGATAGIAAAVLLPLAVCLVLAVGCLVATAAWALAKDTGQQAAYATAALVLVGSSGVSGPGAVLAVEKVLVTVVGAAAAVVVALLLARVTTARAGARRTTPRSATD